MANEICYWDEVDKVQKVRDATAQELAEIQSRLNPSLSDQKIAKKKAATEIRRQKEEIPVIVEITVGQDTYQVNVSAFNGPLLRLVAAQVGGKPTRKIVTAQGSAVQVSQAQLNAIYTAADDYQQSLSDNEFDLYVAIDAATDQTELDAVDINAGWP